MQWLKRGKSPIDLQLPNPWKYMPVCTGIASRTRKEDHPLPSKDAHGEEVSDNCEGIDHEKGSDKAGKILLLFLIWSKAGSSGRGKAKKKQSWIL
jgi:hypothetical protein